QGEAVDRLTHAFCKLGQFTDAPCGSGRTSGSLRGNLLNHVHRVGDVTRGRSLLTGSGGDILNQRREAAGYLLDFLQCHTSVLSQAWSPLYCGSWLPEGDDGFVGIGLNRLDQRFDLFGRTGRTFSQTLDLVGTNRAAPASVTGQRGLDRSVQ